MVLTKEEHEKGSRMSKVILIRIKKLIMCIDLLVLINCCRDHLFHALDRVARRHAVDQEHRSMQSCMTRLVIIA